MNVTTERVDGIALVRLDDGKMNAMNVDGLRAMGMAYAAANLQAPLAAPIHASFEGLPPLYIAVGTRELLLDDATRVADKARAAGVEVELETGPGLIHVWQMFGDDVPEAAESCRRIADFVRKQVA